MLALVLLCASCGPSSFSGSPRQFQATSVSQTAGPSSFDYYPEYSVSPGDVLEVLFRFDPARHQEFKIMPEDIVDIRFLEAPELNLEQRVRPDGKITLPYFEDTQISGMTPQELRTKLEQMYAQVLYSPRLYVVVKEFHTSLNEIKETIRNQSTGQSKLILVRSDGKASFPIIGDVLAAGMPFTELNKTVGERYQAVSPNITAELLLNKASGTKIYVVGAVGTPGAYAIDSPVNVLQAMSMAGGYRTDAELGSVIVVHRQGSTMICTPVDAKSALSGKGAGNSFAYLGAGDIVYVPRMWIADAAQVMEYISQMTLFRGYSLGFSWELHRQGNSVN
jgi:polysaccharide export outer membrane protein